MADVTIRRALSLTILQNTPEICGTLQVQPL
jgi:hypothetical protein